MSNPDESPAPAARLHHEGLGEGGGAVPAASRPRIYAACLAAYNNGQLHGCWIDATDADEVREAVAAMLAASPEPGAEEWAIHGAEGFEGASVSEYASFDEACALAGFIEEWGRLGAKVYEHFGDDLDEARAAFDGYAGAFSSLADFAEELIRETGPEIPKALEFYIDWVSLGRDMALNGDILAFETGFDEVHVFRAR